MRKKKEIIDYSHIDNRKKLLKEFARKYPSEVIRFLDAYDQCNRKGDSKIILDFTTNNPPPYEILKLKKRTFRRFYSFKFSIDFRRMFVSYMEQDLIGKNPRLKIELISNNHF